MYLLSRFPRFFHWCMLLVPFLSITKNSESEPFNSKEANEQFFYQTWKTLCRQWEYCLMFTQRRKSSKKIVRRPLAMPVSYSFQRGSHYSILHWTLQLTSTNSKAKMADGYHLECQCQSNWWQRSEVLCWKNSGTSPDSAKHRYCDGALCLPQLLKQVAETYEQAFAFLTRGEAQFCPASGWSPQEEMPGRVLC